MAPRRLPAGALPLQSEAEFQDSVLELAHKLGWELTYHTYDSRRSTEGFPDLVLCRPRDERLVIAELKRIDGRVTPAQRAWLDALGAARYKDVRVWRPTDWDDIQRLLR